MSSKCTPEQKVAVLRILRCGPTAYYEILQLSKACTDAEVRKAYRKMSLLTHPDKNGHEQAAEAFKMVGEANSVLGDTEQRGKFDRGERNPTSGSGSDFASSGGGFSNPEWMGRKRYHSHPKPEPSFARPPPGFSGPSPGW